MMTETADCSLCQKRDYCPFMTTSKCFCSRYEPEGEHKKMTNQQAMCSLSPEEFYDKMYWLMFKYGRQFNSTELAVIDWLKQEVE